MLVKWSIYLFICLDLFFNFLCWVVVVVAETQIMMVWVCVKWSQSGVLPPFFKVGKITCCNDGDMFIAK